MRSVPGMAPCLHVRTVYDHTLALAAVMQVATLPHCLLHVIVPDNHSYCDPSLYQTKTKFKLLVGPLSFGCGVCIDTP